MKAFFTSLLSLILLSSYFTPTTFAYTENIEHCIERIEGLAQDFSSADLKISDVERQSMANFCLETLSGVHYEDMTEIAQMMQLLAEDFFSRAFLAKNSLQTLAEMIIIDPQLFTLDRQSELLELVDIIFTSMRDNKLSYDASLNSAVESGFVFADNYLNVINETHIDFLDFKRGFENNLLNGGVCYEGECVCVIGLELNDLKQCVAPTVEEEITVGTEEFVFKDVPSLHKNKEAIYTLYDLNIISGYPDGTFKPNNTINRAELLKLIIQPLGVDLSAYKNCYPDVKDQWFAGYVCYAKDQNWVKGYPDGLFRPEKTVNKVEAIKMLLEINGIMPDADKKNTSGFKDLDVNAWYWPYFNRANKLGIIEEPSGEIFDPNGDMTRGSASENIWRLLVISED